VKLEAANPGGSIKDRLALPRVEPLEQPVVDCGLAHGAICLMML
jgi:hypothetical protein